MIHMQHYAFLILSKTWISKHLIYIEWHETCKCKCRLDASVNNQQRWNNEKCRCECKELIDKKRYDKRFICDPSNFQCEFDKS